MLVPCGLVPRPPPFFILQFVVTLIHEGRKAALLSLYILMALIQFSNIQCQQCALGKMIQFISYCQLFHSEAFDKFDS